jgi:hypothetical protein
VVSLTKLRYNPPQVMSIAVKKILKSIFGKGDLLFELWVLLCRGWPDVILRKGLRND